MRMRIYSDDRTKVNTKGERLTLAGKGEFFWVLMGLTLSVQVLTIEVFGVALICRKRGSTKPFSNGQC